MSIGIKEIYQEDPKTLCIIWNTGKKNFYDVVSLRRECPCAFCNDEKTGKKTLNSELIKENIRPIKIQSVGTYALNIIFNDGHKTGLYTYKKLLALGR